MAFESLICVNIEVRDMTKATQCQLFVVAVD
jgi:hypothetical protein